MWHVSYVAFIVFSSPVDGLPLPFLPPLTPPPPLDAPWQKASTRPPIHGALLGRWFSLVILPCWATPPISASMVPSLPLTPKTDWWALPSHFRFVFLWRHNEVFDTFWLMHHWGLLSDCAFKSLGVFAFFFKETAATAPLSTKLPPAWQRGERGSSRWIPLWLQQLRSPQPHTPYRQHWHDYG